MKKQLGRPADKFYFNGNDKDFAEVLIKSSHISKKIRKRIKILRDAARSSVTLSARVNKVTVQCVYKWMREYEKTWDLYNFACPDDPSVKMRKDICECQLDNPGFTTRDIANQLGVNQSTAARQLNGAGFTESFRKSFLQIVTDGNFKIANIGDYQGQLIIAIIKTDKKVSYKINKTDRQVKRIVDFFFEKGETIYIAPDSQIQLDWSNGYQWLIDPLTPNEVKDGIMITKRYALHGKLKKPFFSRKNNIYEIEDCVWYLLLQHLLGAVKAIEKKLYNTNKNVRLLDVDINAYNNSQLNYQTYRYDFCYAQESLVKYLDTETFSLCPHKYASDDCAAIILLYNDRYHLHYSSSIHKNQWWFWNSGEIRYLIITKKSDVLMVTSKYKKSYLYPLSKFEYIYNAALSKKPKDCEFNGIIIKPPLNQIEKDIFNDLLTFGKLSKNLDDGYIGDE